MFAIALLSALSLLARVEPEDVCPFRLESSFDASTSAVPFASLAIAAAVAGDSDDAEYEMSECDCRLTDARGVDRAEELLLPPCDGESLWLTCESKHPSPTESDACSILQLENSTAGDGGVTHAATTLPFEGVRSRAGGKGGPDEGKPGAETMGGGIA